MTKFRTMLMLVTLVLCIQSLNAAVLEVGTEKTYASIQKAWEAAKEGDEIIVYPGTYEPVMNGRCLQAKGKKGIILRTSGDGEVICKGGFYFFRSKFSYILIQGFTFKGALRGIWLDGRGKASYDNIIIRDNVITNCSNEGLYFYNKTDSQKYSNIIVENNTMFKNNVGLHHYVIGTGGNCNWVFRNNIIVNNKLGIFSRGAASFHYSDSWKNPPKGNSNWQGKNCKGTGCVSVDPGFMSTEANSKDFLKLSDKSPKSVLSGGYKGSFMGAIGPNGRIKRNDYKAFFEKFNSNMSLVGKDEVVVKAPEVYLKVSGKIFLDTDNNGKLDAGEQGIAGISVSDGMNIIKSDSNGSYSFNSIPQKSLSSVFVIMPEGYKASKSFFHLVQGNLKEANIGLVHDPKSSLKKFTFIHGSDIQFDIVPQIAKLRDEFTNLKRIIAKSQARFIVCAGDLTPFGKIPNLKAISTEAARLPIPFHAVFGGHDGIKANKTFTTYSKVFGPTIYSWNYGGVHFIAMISEMQNATKQQKRRQWTWLKNDLKSLPAKQPIIIATHLPGRISTELSKLASSYNIVAVLLGHWHQHAHFRVNGTIPAFCSAPWRDLDWGIGTNRVRAITWDNGKLSSKIYPMWESTKTVLSKELNLTSPVKGQWSSFFGEAASGRSSNVKIDLPLKLAWKFNLGSLQPVFNSPLINNGKIYFSVADDQAGFKNSGILCIDASTGKKIWKTSLPGNFNRTGVIVSDSIIAMSSEGLLCSIDLNTGNINWKSPMFPNKFYSASEMDYYSTFGWHANVGPLVVADNRIYAFGGSYTACFDTKNGKLLWREDTKSDRGYKAHGITVGAGKVFGSDYYGVFALSAKSGKPAWQHKFKDMKFEMNGSRGLGTPVFANNALFLPDRFHLRKITPEGKELWATKLPYTLNYTSSPAIADGIAVIAHADKIFALDANNGKVLWSFKCRSSIEAGFGKHQIVRNGSSAAIADGKVFCGSDDGYLYVLDLKNGEKLQEIKIGSPIKASVAIAENFVCVSDFDGRLYAFAKE